MKKLLLSVMLLLVGFTSSAISFDAAAPRQTIKDCPTSACNWQSTSSYHRYVLSDKMHSGDETVSASASNYESVTFYVEALAGKHSASKTGNNITASVTCKSSENCNSTANGIFQL